MSADLNNEDEKLYICYNKGCGMKFKKNENNEDSCCYHAGAPIFHDAYKGWSCCNKRSTDFTTFLNTKGCTKGKHNPVKPEEPIKPKPDSMYKDEVITVCPPKSVSLERPDYNTAMERLKTTVSQSLKEALNKEKKVVTEKENEDIDLGIKVGESCKNNGCQANLKKTSCRYDWHQTGGFVVLTIYAKISQPLESFVEANPIRLKLQITFLDNQEFVMENELGGIIVPSESSVTMAATKVEVKLRKAEPKHWNKIFLPERTIKVTKDTGNKSEQNCNLSVDAIDLNDI
ncbi:Cysteine and histidine-rich domain-containing protein [Armadillidium nasatum]|uniref:Cysteine and histidine-rich domain-containing protein n=1 Tax=Armadillidium nasatum TaxID=96803 RepID=A0A5N5TLF0_9CRUS|nr:Cysteine and histidine-rich domain-containing protein [Armadillidium nasatum]